MKDIKEFAKGNSGLVERLMGETYVKEDGGDDKLHGQRLFEFANMKGYLETPPTNTQSESQPSSLISDYVKYL